MSFILRVGILAAIALLYNAPTVFTQMSPAVDEYHVSNVENGLQEIVAVSGKVVAVETRQTGKLVARQMTNGHDLLTLVYVDGEKLAACEKLQGRSPELDHFLDQHLNTTPIANNGTGVSEEVNDAVENDVRFNGSLVDWNRSWKDCVRLQETMKERFDVADAHSPRRSQRRGRALTLPGSNWCGVGGTKGYGRHVETDKCCHQHDRCPVAIPPFRRKFHLFNPRYYTLSDCNCDSNFRHCLQRVNNDFSRLVGNTYFNVLRLKCFVLDTKTICTKRKWYGKCIQSVQRVEGFSRDPTPF